MEARAAEAGGARRPAGHAPVRAARPSMYTSHHSPAPRLQTSTSPTYVLEEYSIKFEDSEELFALAVVAFTALRGPIDDLLKVSQSASRTR